MSANPSASEIAAQLTERTEDLAVDILGEPTSHNRVQLRWGRRGSLAVCVAGPKAGQWFDHETDAGGDLLALVKHQRGGSIGDAMRWARHWLELHPDNAPLRRARPQPKHDNDDDQARIRMALSLFREAGSIKNTMGENTCTVANSILTSPRPRRSASIPGARAARTSACRP